MVSYYSTNGTSTCVATDTIWLAWSGTVGAATTTACTNTTASTWTYWCDATNVYHGQLNNVYQPSELTAEERAARDERNAALAEERRQHALQLEAARKRAKKLLVDNLNRNQRAQLAKHGWFVVKGGQSGKKYRINAGAYAGNVYELPEAANDNEPRHVASYCGHIDQHLVPVEDNALAQKLMLEAAEDEFLRIANRRAA